MTEHRFVTLSIDLFFFWGESACEPKEQYYVKGAGHVDLYDKLDLIHLTINLTPSLKVMYNEKKQSTSCDNNHRLKYKLFKRPEYETESNDW